LGWQGLVVIIRIIRDGNVIEESENLQEVHEKLIILDAETKYIQITVAKHK
jgi:hypothetical protein